MKIKLLPAIIAAAGFLTVPFALAATYQSEISASYADIDSDAGADDIYAAAVEGKYYISPVDTSGHPLAEAAFLEKASNIYVTAAVQQWKDDGFHADVYERSVGIDFYVPNSLFYLGAGVREDKYQTKYSADTTNGASAITFGRSWDSEWFVKAGITPIDGLLIWSEFVEDSDISEKWNINGKYVVALTGEQALNIEASYENSDEYFPAEAWSGAVDYYIDRHLSVGGGFTHSTFENEGLNRGEDATDYFIRARNYFTDNIGVELGYVDGEHEDSLTLGASIRF